MPSLPWRAAVTFQKPDGAVVALVPGDIVGRTQRAALVLDDGRISEAHALVSLRGDELKLLPLRGRLAVDGVPRHEVTLEPGRVVALARGLELVVLDVLLPDALLALSAGDAPTALLGTTSVIGARPLQLQPGWANEALGWVWPSDDGWRLRTPDGATRPIAAGDRLALGDATIEVCAVPIGDAAQAATRADPGLASPIRVVARFHSVHLHRDGELVLVLDGVSARIISELAALGGPTSWEVVARELWRDGADLLTLRARWDAALVRLRARLREVGVRADLVRSDRQGHVELRLGPGDALVDET